MPVNGNGSDAPAARGPRLHTIANVRTFVARVLRRVDAGTKPGAPLDPTRARVLLYGASILAQLVTDGELEERIAALERAQSHPRPEAVVQ